MEKSVFAAVLKMNAQILYIYRMFICFSEFYESASRQSSAPQAVRQREEVGSYMRSGKFTSTLFHKPATEVALSAENSHSHALLCFQERFQVKNPPHTYIQKLRGYLDPGVTRKVGSSISSLVV